MSVVKSKKSFGEVVENEIVCRISSDCFISALNVDSENIESIRDNCEKILAIDSEIQAAIKERSVLILSNLRYERETTLRLISNTIFDFD